MGKVTAIKMDPVTKKTAGGVTIAFPDVCKTPVPASPIPIPYPAIAKTANEIQKKKKQVPSGSKVSRSSKFSMSSVDEAGSLRGVVSNVNMDKAAYRNSGRVVNTGRSNLRAKTEIQMLKTKLNSLNSRIQTLESVDPNVWQNLLVEYVNHVGAIFVTMHGQDDA